MSIEKEKFFAGPDSVESLEVSESKPEKIKHREIEELREPTKRILEQIGGKIEKGDYELIISDDASGRIPTLIFGKIISGIYEKRGYKKPQTLFFAGSRHIPNSMVGEKIEKIRKRIQKHELFLTERNKGEAEPEALVVTDTIFTGSSLLPLAAALKREGIVYDIATITETLDDQEPLQEKLGGNIYSGMLKKGTPSIYAHSQLSGVGKRPLDLFSYSIKKGLPSEFRKGFSEGIKEAREDVTILSQELILWYEKNKKRKKGLLHRLKSGLKKS